MTTPVDPQTTATTAPAQPAGGPPREIRQVRLTGRRWWSEVGWRHVVGGTAVVLSLIPVLYLFSAALNPRGSAVTTGLIPTDVSLVHFQALLADTPSRPFVRWYVNTVVVCTAVTLIQVFCSALGAYAFSRFRFRGRRGGLLTLLLVQLFPQFLAVVALFALFTDIGEVIPPLGLNTLPGYVLVLAGNALAQVWLVKGFFDSIPKELDEAAIMDGAGHATVYFRIILPLVRPILAVTGLLAFIAVIGEFIIASIFLTDNEVKTLAVGLFGILDADRSNNLGIFAAASIVTAVPVVLLFQYLQRFIVGGLTAGSVKG